MRAAELQLLPSDAFARATTDLPLPPLDARLLSARQASRAPLSAESVARCARAVNVSSWSASGDTPILLTYATGALDAHGVAYNASAARHPAARAAAAQEGGAGGGGARLQHPWLLHANGHHYQMRAPVLAPVLELYATPARRAALLDYPILLLEGAHATCEVTTLRAVMNMSR